MTCFGPSRQAFFRPKCKTLLRLEAPTSFRTYDTISLCDTCEYVVSYQRHRSYDRCSIVGTIWFRELLPGHLVSAQTAGGGVAGQRARSTVTTPRHWGVERLIPSMDRVWHPCFAVLRQSIADHYRKSICDICSLFYKVFASSITDCRHMRAQLNFSYYHST